MDNNRHFEWLMEQLAAFREIIHTYKCAYCNMATATEVLVIVRDEPEGARVTMLPICDTCIPDEAKGEYDGT